MAIQNFSPLQLNSTLTVGVDDTGHDVKFFGATAGKFLLWDESADRLIFTDNTYLALGSSSDALVYHTGSHTHFANYTGDLIIENNHDDGDIEFKTDNGGGSLDTYLRINGTSHLIEHFKSNKFYDNVKATFGRCW